jgi:hypothetical protein
MRHVHASLTDLLPTTCSLVMRSHAYMSTSSGRTTGATTLGVLGAWVQRTTRDVQTQAQHKTHDAGYALVLNAPVVVMWWRPVDGRGRSRESP